MKFKKGESGIPRIEIEHEDETTGNALALHALGASDWEFFDGLLIQILNLTLKRGEPDLPSADFVLSMVKGIEPRDQVEAMLAAQMAAVHMASMTFARRLAHVENIPQQDSAERAFNKLTRTFAAQVSALKDYRSRGEQRVTVQRVNVSEGGQAVIGIANSAGGGDA